MAALCGAYAAPSNATLVAQERPTMANKTWTELLAWGFIAFTVLIIIGMLRLWWEERRETARLKKTLPLSDIRTCETDLAA